MSKRLGSGDFTVGHGVHSQAPAESIRQWVHRETRRQERATHTPAGEPIEKLFESRTRSLQELRDLQLGLHMRMQARATGSLGRSAATTSGVAQDPASATTTGRVEAPATTQALLAHETGAMDRRVGDPGHAASVQARVSSAKYMPHLVHHSDLGWGYQGIKNQELLGQFKKSADRGVRYGESMKFAMEASRWKNATLDR